MLERHEFICPAPIRLEAGGSIEQADLVYYTSPRPYKRGEKVIWICHALTGNADPEDWWPQMVGDGNMIDPQKHYIVCGAMLCSAYGKCGPAATNPATGKPYLLDFPLVTIRDMVKALTLVREHIGIETIDLLIGPSIGGYVAYEWSIIEAERIRHAAFIATTSRVHPYFTAFTETQRMALEADPTFRQARSIDGGREGLRCARAIALISYRYMDGYNSTQMEKDEDFLFAERVASYQRHQGDKLVQRDFDAYSYWYLSKAMDSQNPGRGRGGMDAALGSIKARCTVINICSDQIFPAHLGREDAEKIPDSEFFEIRSSFGHDGFLIENDQLQAILGPVLETL